MMYATWLMDYCFAESLYKR